VPQGPVAEGRVALEERDCADEHRRRKERVVPVFAAHRQLRIVGRRRYRAKVENETHR